MLNKFRKFSSTLKNTQKDGTSKYIHYGDKSCADFKNDKYEDIYNHSINNKKDFWSKLATDLHWFKPFSNALDTSDEHFPKWFQDGKINMAYNCLDRHILSGYGKNICFYEESAYTGLKREWTYEQVYQ